MNTQSEPKSILDSAEFLGGFFDKGEPIKWPEPITERVADAQPLVDELARERYRESMLGAKAVHCLTALQNDQLADRAHLGFTSHGTPYTLIVERVKQ